MVRGLETSPGPAHCCGRHGATPGPWFRSASWVPLPQLPSVCPLPTLTWLTGHPLSTGTASQHPSSGSFSGWHCCCLLLAVGPQIPGSGKGGWVWLSQGPPTPGKVHATRCHVVVCCRVLCLPIIQCLTCSWQVTKRTMCTVFRLQGTLCREAQLPAPPGGSW